MIRTGIGFDTHAFVYNRKLVIGGVIVPFEKGLAGHSDADVLVHAIIDAILGAAALGDIGLFFPSSDNNFKDINSLVLLKKTVVVAGNAGFKIVNSDSTVILQTPVIQPYIKEMRLNIAGTLNVDVSQVSVKATTTDRLGFTGKGEGVAALSTVLLEKIG
jgi:2-C-methyl-D-erythritol 2,4-cyclodiphosphate synthase